MPLWRYGNNFLCHSGRKVVFATALHRHLYTFVLRKKNRNKECLLIYNLPPCTSTPLSLHGQRVGDRGLFFMEQILHLINEMSPFLLLGFLLAGLMHAFIPGQIYSRYLAKPTFSSVLYAALFGIPLPLCSCGVIPTAMSLRKEGARGWKCMGKIIN